MQTYVGTLNSRKSAKYGDNRLFLDIWSRNQLCRALVDSGAQISIVSRTYANRLGLTIEKSTLGKVTGIMDNAAKILGEIKIDFNIMNFRAENVTFQVIEGLKHEMLIGADIMYKYCLNLDLFRKKLTYNPPDKDKIDICFLSSCSQNIDGKKLVLKKKIVVKPFNVRMIEVELEGGLGKVPLSYGEPCLNIDGIYVPHVVCGDNNKTFMQIINVQNEPIKINRGTSIAILEEIKDKTEKETVEIDDFSISEIYDDIDVRKEFRLDETDLEEIQKDEVVILYNTYENVISKHDSDVGHVTAAQHKIDLLDNNPIKQRSRRVGPILEEKIEKEIKILHSQDIIEPSNSPWSSPVVPVIKKDGSLRLCIDYRKVNYVTKKDSFPIPNLTDSLYSLHGNEYFSTLDLTKGYYNIDMDEASKEVTAFKTAKSFMQFKKLPFGLSGAPSTFQRLMNLIFDDSWKHVVCYLDDILIMSKTFREHVKRTEEVLKKLSEYNLKIKPSKCNIFRKEVEYLGNVVSKEGLKPLPRTLETIENYPVPKSIRQIRAFLGLINFYRRHIPNCSEIMKPLSRLTGGNSVKWTEECQASFDKLKLLLVSPPILSFPNYNFEDPETKPLELVCDASKIGAGAVLLQEQNGLKRTIGYASMTFHDAQRNYCTNDKELAALRWAVKTFRPFLLSGNFLLYTDNRAATYLYNMANINSRVARTLTDLSEY